MRPVLISEVSLNHYDLKEELGKIKKRDKELNFRAKQTEDYINRFSPLSGKGAKEIFKKLEGLKIPRMKDNHFNKIIDLMPETVEELKAILQAYTITVTKKNMEEIIKVLKENK